MVYALVVVEASHGSSGSIPQDVEKLLEKFKGLAPDVRAGLPPPRDIQHQIDFIPEGLKMDEEKVRAILNWPTPKSFMDVRSFHGLASFYRRLIKKFSTIIAPMMDVLKIKEFKCSSEAG